MTSDSGVKIDLRNKITCLEAKLKKKDSPSCWLVKNVQKAS